jgi:hypothetical protein
MTVRELIEHLAQFDGDMNVLRADEMGEPTNIDHIDIENVSDDQYDNENVVIIT